MELRGSDVTELRSLFRFVQRLAAFLASSSLGYAQDAVQRRPLITQSIAEVNLVTLHGNTRPEVRTAKDLGPVPDDLQLEHIYLLMNRPPKQQVEIDDLVERLQHS